MESMKFKWRDDPPLSFPSDFGDDGYRLAKYVVSFNTEKDMQVIFYGEGTCHAKGWEIRRCRCASRWR